MADDQVSDSYESDIAYRRQSRMYDVVLKQHPDRYGSVARRRQLRQQQQSQDGAAITSTEPFPLQQLPEDVVWHALGFLKDIDLDQRRQRQDPAERPPLDPVVVRNATEALLLHRNLLANVCAGWRRRLQQEDEGDETSWLRRLFVRPKQQAEQERNDDDEKEEEGSGSDDGDEGLGALLAEPPAVVASDSGSGVQVRVAWLVAALPVLRLAGRAQREELASALIHLLHAAAAAPAPAATSSLVALDQGEDDDVAWVVDPPFHPVRVTAELNITVLQIVQVFWEWLDRAVPRWVYVPFTLPPFDSERPSTSRDAPRLYIQPEREYTSRDEAHAIKILALGEALMTVTGWQSGRHELLYVRENMLIHLFVWRAMYASPAERAAFFGGEGGEEETPEDANLWGIGPTSLRRRSASLLALMGEELGPSLLEELLFVLLLDDDECQLLREGKLLALGALALPCANHLAEERTQVLPWVTAQLRHSDPMVRCLGYWGLWRTTQALLQATNAQQAALVQRAITLCERGMAMERDGKVALAAARALADLIEFLPHGRVRRLRKCLLNLGLRELARAPHRPGPYHVLGALVDALGPELVGPEHLPRVLGAVLGAWASIRPRDNRQLFAAELVLMLMQELGTAARVREWKGRVLGGPGVEGGDEAGPAAESRRLLRAWLPRCMAAARLTIEANAAAPTTRLRSKALGAAVDVCATALDLTAVGDPALFLAHSAPWLPQAVLPILRRRDLPPCVSVPLHILLGHLVQLAPAQMLPSLPEWFPGLAATITNGGSRRDDDEATRPSTGRGGPGGGVDLGLDGRRRGQRCDTTRVEVLNNAIFAAGRVVYRAHGEQSSSASALAPHIEGLARVLCRIVASAPALPGEEDAGNGAAQQQQQQQQQQQEEDNDGVVINLDEEDDPAAVAREERRMLRVTAAAALGSLAFHAPAVVHRQLLAMAARQRQLGEALAARWAILLLNGHRLRDGFTDQEEFYCGVLGLGCVLDLDGATPSSPHALLHLADPLPPPPPPTGAGESRQQSGDRVPPSAVLWTAWVMLGKFMSDMVKKMKLEVENVQANEAALIPYIDSPACLRILYLLEEIVKIGDRVLSGEAVQRGASARKGGQR